MLSEKLKLPPVKKTKTGYSTDADVLEQLALGHELPARIIEHRPLGKLKSTYADALPMLVNPTTGRLHTSFNQLVAATGRLSSSNPNLQNIPVRTELGRRIRAAFVPDAGWRFVAADYSQIELRILAHASGEESLIEAFRRGEDIHARTASEVFGVPLDAVTPEQRDVAMATNAPIQGTAADLVKIAMVRMARELRAHRLESRMLLQVHDELLFEAPAAEVGPLQALATEVMESALTLDVPLKVDVKVGDDWAAV